jgi:tetratricopeptide (TPR) repeat protein
VAEREPSAASWFYLGQALMATRKLSEAETALSRAIALDPALPEAHLNLATVLKLQGRLDESQAAGERALKEAGKKLELKRLARTHLSEVRRWKELDKQLPAVRTGQVRPSAADRVVVAELCSARGLPLTAARLYQEEIAAEEAGNSSSLVRYQAALSALAAGLGRGIDTSALQEEERAVWRKRGLDWMVEQMSMFAKAKKTTRNDWRAFEKLLRLTRSDSALASVRQPEALARLLAEERQRWQQFWKNVDALLQRSQRQR